MPSFTTITNAFLIQRIEHALETVIYAAPGLFRNVADAIFAFRNSALFGKHRHAEVLVDADAEVCRMGYGEIEAIEKLLENGVLVRQVDGLRIGILIIDESAWIFSPAPQVIEAEPEQSYPNAVFVTESQARRLLLALAPELASPEYLEQVAEYEKIPAKPEIGTVLLSPGRLQAEKYDLEMCPPQKFDLARRIRVYSSFIQFVELTLTGCHLQRHTVNIPKELLNLTNNQDSQERLRATYRLISEKSELSSHEEYGDRLC